MAGTTRTTELHVLVVDDNADDRRVVLRELRRSYPDVVADEPLGEAEFRRALDAGGFHVVVTECRLAWGNGIDVLRAVKARHPLRPVLMYTASDGLDLAVEAMKAGLDDYLLKTASGLARLPAAVGRALERLGRETSRLEHEARVAELGRRALRGLGLDALFDEAVRAVAAALDIEFCKLLERLPDGRLMLRAGVGWHPGLVGRVLVGPAADSQAARALETGEPVVTDDWSTETRFVASRLLREHGVASGVELLVGGPTRVFGVLGAYTARRRTFGPRDIAFLRSVADLLAAAIDRQQAEDALRSGERQARAVFDSALDAMLLASSDRRYVDVNPAACTLLGLGRDALLARRVDDILPPETRAGIDRTWTRFLEQGETTGEIEVLRADGARRTVEFRARADVLPGRHLTVLRDVTERRRLEANLEQVQRLEAVGRLAGGVAHDFNNFMTAILGYSDLLIGQGRLAPGDVRSVEEIRGAADRASALTRQLLAFSRRQVLKPVPVDLSRLVADMEGLLRRLVGETVELAIAVAPDPPLILGDPAQLEQVVMNLAVNARDAMPGGGRLTVSTAAIPLSAPRAMATGTVPPGRYVRLEVADTGIGIEPSIRERLFEPFFTTKAPGKGTGLGLATVYGIVQQSGGHLDVESEPGRGARFEIYLPELPYDGPVRAAAPVRAETGTLGHETILVVEDDPSVRELARRLLEASGYRVLAAEHGEAAIDLAGREAGPIHLVLTDVVMPGLGGPDMVLRLRAVRPDVRVLFMSGYAEEAVARETLASPDTSFLTKPFTGTVLRQRVREVLDRPA